MEQLTQTERAISISEGEQDSATLFYEQKEIKVPLNFKNEKEKILFGTIKDLKKRVENLEKELENTKLIDNLHIEKQLPDNSAKKEIISYLKHMKSEGNTKISIIDLVSELKLPVEQIERIMDTIKGRKIEEL